MSWTQTSAPNNQQWSSIIASSSDGTNISTFEKGGAKTKTSTFENS